MEVLEYSEAFAEEEGGLKFSYTKVILRRESQYFYATTNHRYRNASEIDQATLDLTPIPPSQIWPIFPPSVAAGSSLLRCVSAPPSLPSSAFSLLPVSACLPHLVLITNDMQTPQNTYAALTTATPGGVILIAPTGPRKTRPSLLAPRRHRSPASMKVLPPPGPCNWERAADPFLRGPRPCQCGVHIRA